MWINLKANNYETQLNLDNVEIITKENDSTKISIRRLSGATDEIVCENKEVCQNMFDEIKEYIEKKENRKYE